MAQSDAFFPECIYTLITVVLKQNFKIKALSEVESQLQESFESGVMFRRLEA